MQKIKPGTRLSTDRKVLVWVFLLFTLIALIQFLQYFIAYNSSYPFPWRWNLGLTFGTFYTYYVFVPIIFRACQKLQSWQLSISRWLGFHLLLALVFGLLHLSIINLIEWLQVRAFSEEGYLALFRWKIARYLHLEILMYAFITGIWYVVQLLRWRQASKGEATGVLETKHPKLTRLKVKNGGDTRFVEIDQIRWLEAYDNYVKCHLAGHYLLVRSTLSGIEKELDPSGFQRIHRSCIVALAEVEKIKSQGGKSEVILHDGTALRLSKTYKQRLEQRLFGDSPA